MAQNIEFFLHPPSPKVTVNQYTLPPVSPLFHESHTNIRSLPSLCLPFTSPGNSDIDPYSENSSLPSLSPFMGSLLLDSPPSHNRLLPLPTNTRTRSLSNASTNSTCSLNSILNDPLETNLLNNTLKESDLSSDPVEPIKRKRGRPPNSTKPIKQGDHWTFVTPTVWDVKHTSVVDSKPKRDNCNVLHWPTQANQNTFTPLSIPKKKRGRKPKMQLEGNFCFVWRDLTARRGPNKKK